MKKYFLDFLAIYKPNRKKSNTDNVVPLPLPKCEPININKKIILDEKILKFIPNTAPTIKKVIINIVFPKPIPKCDPTKPI